MLISESEQFEIRRTGYPKVYSNSTVFTWLNRLYCHFGKDLEHFVNLFMQPYRKAADKRRISLWLNSLLREIGIRGPTAYSFIYAASTAQARQILETTKLNILHITVYFQELQAATITLLRSSIAQPLALPFDEILPVGRGIEPIDNTRARSDMIYIDQYDSDDIS
ncbi:MAG: hypothetical protein EZS28_053632 [Streblomastix strix]|uniref:Uncharacterized protein n=1 Tax=Streblomastix strix TaxID=222440 RepID=A0A5J4R7U9_9EUKA|nr:MAG: hypothetical protein EZS28_053632 [Streblomastix strix]